MKELQNIISANEGATKYLQPMKEVQNIISPSQLRVIKEKLFLKHNNSNAQIHSFYISANAQLLLALYAKMSVKKNLRSIILRSDTKWV
jgi:hypothetical protein